MLFRRYRRESIQHSQTIHAMTAKKAPEVRKEEIYEAALHCFNRKGYYGTSIDNIAAQAEISKGGIYHHFSSKKSLFIELFNSRVNSYFEVLTANIDSVTGPAERIRDFVEKSDQIFQQNRDVLKFFLEFMTLSTRDPAIRKAVTRVYKNRVTIFTRILSEGIEEGSFKKLEARSVARTLYFLSMGFFLNYFTVNIDFDLKKQHSINMTTILEGIRK
jgi:AcrR family transcriptional regulator